MNTSKPDKEEIQGEGDYKAGRRYDKSAERFRRIGQGRAGGAQAPRRTRLPRPRSSGAPRRPGNRTPRARTSRPGGGKKSGA